MKQGGNGVEKAVRGIQKTVHLIFREGQMIILTIKEGFWGGRQRKILKMGPIIKGGAETEGCMRYYSGYV